MGAVGGNVFPAAVNSQGVAVGSADMTAATVAFAWSKATGIHSNAALPQYGREGDIAHGTGKRRHCDEGPQECTPDGSCQGMSDQE